MSRPERCVVVIDDDPTGCQTVAGVPIVTRWETEDLRWLLTRHRGMGFVLTNSRAMHPEQAAAATRTIVERTQAVAAETGVGVSFLSRGDSTLRGHFAVETQAVCSGLAAHGIRPDLLLFAPAFFEAGRRTHGDVHYVADGDHEVPVGDTAYACDETFGFTESNLVQWVRARLDDRAARVSSLSVDDVRAGRDAIAGRLRAAVSPRWLGVVVVNGTHQSDYDVVADAVAELEAEGHTVVTRCGPSYVASRLGEPVPAPVTKLPAVADAVGHGLVVVGSHVPVTTAQLKALVDGAHPTVVELDPATLVTAVRRQHVAAVAADVSTALQSGDVVLATSRTVLTAHDPRASLDAATTVAAAVDDAVRAVLARCTPSWIVAKGGITSATMVSNVLELRRGWIVGQMFRGLLPLWSDDDTSRRNPPLVIFPGNVGTTQTLLELVGSLNAHRASGQSRSSMTTVSSPPPTRRHRAAGTHRWSTHG